MDGLYAMYDFLVESLSRPQFAKKEAGIDRMWELTPWLPIAASVGYIVMVFGGQAIMSGLNKLNTRWAVIFWNLLLAVFSIQGAIVLVPAALQYANGGSAGSLGNYLCNPPEGLYDASNGIWILLFILSKIPEMLDTFFLVVQKKTVIFLHWYHHLTVMWFCWHAGLMANPAGIFYGGMNFFVHSLMYSYYFLTCFSVTRKMVKPIAPVITTLQILQMVVGMIISVLCSFEMITRSECIGLDWWNVQAGTVMYISYFVLFSILFKKHYIDKKKTDKNKNSEKDNKKD